MSVNVLGISAFFHDSAAALVRDGDILAAAQEERFSRAKGDPNLPTRAIEYCLQAGGIRVTDLDYVVFYERPLLKFERLITSYLTSIPTSAAAFQKAFPVWSVRKLRIPELIREHLGDGFSGEVLTVGHHEAHAASAFYPSPFENAAVLTLDAVGEWDTSSIGIGRGSELDLLLATRFPHSLGMLYSAFTHYAGFKVNSGEYKLMGLAPYGQPRYADTISREIVTVNDDGSLELSMSYFDYERGLAITSSAFHDLFGGPPRSPESFITQKEMDLASSIQVVCEDVVLRSASYAHQLTGTRNLVMAGGVALNCVANGRLSREGPFENIWVQPAAGDAGGALGAALLTWHKHLGKPRHCNPGDGQKGSFLGPSFPESDISVFLDSVGARYEYIEDENELLRRVAYLLAEENIVGWFQGRMEYGPRALGHRSILGDPRSPRMQQTMNLKIKYRESFRPFAPCVLREHVHEFFETRPEEDSPYMLFVAPVRDEARIPLSAEELRRMEDPDLRIRVAVPRSVIPAVTHVDFSARIQTVDSERHGRFYSLMKRFHELTDCPVVVNTSFNIRGEPIVCTPEDAFRCFMGTEMDCLVLERFLLLKSAQSPELLNDSESYKERFALD